MLGHALRRVGRQLGVRAGTGGGALATRSTVDLTYPGVTPGDVIVAGFALGDLSLATPAGWTLLSGGSAAFPVYARKWQPGDPTATTFQIAGESFPIYGTEYEWKWDTYETEREWVTATSPSVYIHHTGTDPGPHGHHREPTYYWSTGDPGAALMSHLHSGGNHQHNYDYSATGSTRLKFVGTSYGWGTSTGPHNPPGSNSSTPVKTGVTRQVITGYGTNSSAPVTGALAVVAGNAPTPTALAGFASLSPASGAAVTVPALNLPRPGLLLSFILARSGAVTGWAAPADAQEVYDSGHALALAQSFGTAVPGRVVTPASTTGLSVGVPQVLLAAA